LSSSFKRAACTDVINSAESRRSLRVVKAFISHPKLMKILVIFITIIKNGWILNNKGSFCLHKQNPYISIRYMLFTSSRKHHKYCNTRLLFTCGHIQKTQNSYSISV